MTIRTWKVHPAKIYFRSFDLLLSCLKQPSELLCPARCGFSCPTDLFFSVASLRSPALILILPPPCSAPATYFSLWFCCHPQAPHSQLCLLQSQAQLRGVKVVSCPSITSFPQDPFVPDLWLCTTGLLWCMIFTHLHFSIWFLPPQPVLTVGLSS